MADKAVGLVLEQVLLDREAAAPAKHDIVTFHVGGRSFQILEQTIRSRGQTLLSDLLDDPERKDKLAAVHVEGDSERFRYILDWFRFGSIKLPPTMAVSEMKRECAFYALPDGVDISQESLGHLISGALDIWKTVREEAMLAAARAAAHVLFDILINEPDLARTGKVRKSWSQIGKVVAGDWQTTMIYSALVDEAQLNKAASTFSINAGEYGSFATTLKTLAGRHGLQVDIQTASWPITIELSTVG